MKNTVTFPQAPEYKPVKDYLPGTLVIWDNEVFVVLANQSTNIGAVALSDGDFITPTATVMALPPGSKVQLTAF